MSDSEEVLDAPGLLLQALIETSLETVKLLEVRSSATWIADQLGSSDDPLDALARLEGGKENYELLEGPRGGQLVLLKRCPFQVMLNKLTRWSEQASHMVRRFNESPRGGAALHPICITHLSVREAYGGVNLGCRSMTSGKVAVSVKDLLDEVGLDEDEVRELLERKACLYWLR